MNEERRLRFIGSIAKLVQPDDAEAAAKAMQPYLLMLVDIPDEAFLSKECLDMVAMAKRRTIVPSYANVREAMLAWLNSRPKALLPGLEDAARHLSGMDLHWFQYFRTRESENFAPPRPGAPLSSRAHVLGLIRAQSRPAWDALTGNTSHRLGEPTDDERAAVADSARRAREAMEPPRVPRSHSTDEQFAAVRASLAETESKAKALPPQVVAHRDAAKEKSAAFEW